MATMSAHPPAPTPPPRPTATGLLRELRQLRPAPPRRWAFSLRAALAMGLPVLAGWWGGDLAAGMMATIGGFTSLYCSTRPYAARAIGLAATALAFALAVMFGLWLEHYPVLVVPALALVAMLATWTANALRLGPPGAYLFVLACAAGTALPASHIQPWQAGVLVLCGGAGAWLLHMLGALLHPRGPERQAVAMAARAVAAHVAAGGHAPAPRRHAAQALHESWQTLVGFQPFPARRGGELERLRALNRQLHLVFAQAMDETLGPEQRAQLQGQANELAAQAQAAAIRRPAQLPPGPVPHGYPRSWTLLREGIAPGSNNLRTLLRVGLATAMAGLVAGALELERAYWAIAAALLMLHMGLDWPRTVVRAAERTVGTWCGLLLAGAVLAWHPAGPWLALAIAVLQFTIEMTVVRNYALAVVFITAAALTIASGGQPVADIGGMLLARGLDTLLGCACALLAYRLLPPRADARTLAQGMAQCLLALRTPCQGLARGEVTSTTARAARRDLQHAGFLLEQRVDEAIAGSRPARLAAERWWPGVSICQRLVYRVLAACWDLEREPGPAAHPAFTAEEAAALLQALQAQADALLALRLPPPLPGALPALLQGDLRDLDRFLRAALAHAD